jgi:hypothetical protein
MSEQALAIVNLGLIEIANKNNTTKKRILETMNPQEIYDFIRMNFNLRSLINSSNLRYEIYKYIQQLVFDHQNKKIESISTDNIYHSIHNRDITRLSIEEMRIIFDAMKNNLELYERLYRHQIYDITTTQEEHYLINITSSKLLHLLGISFVNMQKYYRRDILNYIPELRDLLNINYKDACRLQTEDLLEVLKIIVNAGDRIIQGILENDAIAKAFPMHKIKTKNFAFERLGLIDAPSGIVLYDKESNPNHPKTYLQSDLFILRDFIKDFQLQWIFNGYAPYRPEIRDAETLLIETDHSDKFEGQRISISSHIETFRRSNFDFSISSNDPFAFGFPNDYIIFEERDIILEAEKIIESYPKAKIHHLQDIIQQGFRRRRSNLY